MPLDLSTTLPQLVTFTLLDNNGNRGYVSFNIPAGLTLAQIVDTVKGLEVGIAAISDARIERASVELEFTQPAAYTYAAPPSSEVERKLAFTFVDATGRYKFTPEVPSPVFTLETNGTDVVNLLDLNVITFTNAVLNGPLGAGNGAVSYGGSDLTRVLKAYVMHRNRKRSR